MAITVGNKVVHALISKAAFTELQSKDADTIYFVGDANGLELYKGGTKVGGGFAVLGSNPSDTTGMQEGVLYLAPNGKMYYKSGSSLVTAFDLVQSTTSDGASNATEVPSVAAMYSAISAAISAAMAGTYRSSVLAPAADVTALKAVTGMEDKDIIFVESLNALFSYDEQSSATANDTTVVSPASGTGCWLKTQAGFAYDSSDFTWGSNGLELSSTVAAAVAAVAGKLDAPTVAGSDGQYLQWDATAGKAKWATLTVPAAINVVGSAPTVTSADNGKVYYNTATDAVYVVKNGVLVQTSLTVSDISWNVIS